jgi:nucleoside-triphosphatase
MSSTAPRILLTGDPGCGKTTVVRRVVERLTDHVSMTGFLTEEIRELGTRKGFRGRTLDGHDFLLAHVDSESDLRVGPYGVEVEGLERVGVPSLTPTAETDLIVLDEIGKMESFSEAFRERVVELLEGDTPVLATVAVHGVGFVKRVRHHRGAMLVRMTRKSRDGMVGDLLRRLAGQGIGPSKRRGAGEPAGAGRRS